MGATVGGAMGAMAFASRVDADFFENLHGAHLRFCRGVYFSRRHKLTEEQREELSYTGTLTWVVKVCLVPTDNVTSVLLLASGVHYGLIIWSDLSLRFVSKEVFAATGSSRQVTKMKFYPLWVIYINRSTSPRA